MSKLLFLLFFLVACTQIQQSPPQFQDEVQDYQDTIKNLSSKNYTARKMASDVLVDQANQSLDEIILSLSKEPYENHSTDSFNARWNKVNVLGRIANPKAQEVIIKRIIHDEETHVRWRAIWAINQMADQYAIQMLTKALNDNNTRWRAAVGLGAMKQKSAADTLVEGMNNDDDWIVWEAIYTLGILKDKKTAKHIATKLNHSSLRVRQEVVLTLGKLKDSATIQSLQTALNDPEPGVRWRAASALANFGNNTLRMIETAYQNEKDQEAKSYINKSLNKLRST